MTGVPWLLTSSALAAPALVAVVLLAVGSCDTLVTTGGLTTEPQPDAEPGCLADEDCELGEICSLGSCVPGCREDDDRCPPGEFCIGGDCYALPEAGLDATTDADGEAPDTGPVQCPEDMVPVNGTFCMDRYEASRPDATEVSPGEDNSMATSRLNVLPWYPVTKSTAAGACALAGKRLCTPSEFQTSCSGTGSTVYSYGDSYDPVICNGIDTYCMCGSGSACEGVSPCPYPHCYNMPPDGQSQPANGCGSWMSAEPTGSFDQCHSDYGAVDINGNVWELVDDGSETGQFRGGAYNCIDSELLHRCDHIAINILAKGFRCCK